MSKTPAVNARTLDADQKRLLAVQTAHLTAKMLGPSEIAQELGITRELVRRLKKSPAYQEAFDSITSEAKNRAKGYLALRSKKLLERATDALDDMLDDPDHRSKGINTVFKALGLLDTSSDDGPRDSSLTVVLPGVTPVTPAIDVTPKPVDSEED